MPVPMRTTYLKAEAKYNVTTEFPSLGLHSAAATGNIGLVEYALDHGQPINSVVDGVLPLHAASAGGNVQVVKMLIDHGADVNAPRLPRRYSNERNRDTSAPIVGTSGSTPLHFAAANGNKDVIILLLLHGAHADLADKHSVTPELLARQHGWLECADVLKEWVLNKDRDLRERPGGRAPRATAAIGHYARECLESLGTDGEASSPSSTRRRLHMKHSIDTALNILKSSSTGISDSYLKPPPPSSSVTNLAFTPPATPGKAFGEYAHDQAPLSDDERSVIDGESQRPSPLYVPQSTSAGRSRHRRTPNQVSSSTSPQRPRSACSGADTQDDDLHPPFGRGGAGRKLGNKYSLMNIFKKAQSSDGGTSMPAEGSLSTSSLSPSGGASATDTPLPSFPHSVHPFSNIPPLRQHENENVNSSMNMYSTTTTTSGSPFSRAGLRFHRGSDASARPNANSQQSPSSQSLHQIPDTAPNSPPRIPLSLAVDLHNALAQQQQDKQQSHRSRDRSGSTGSGPKYPDDNPAVSPSSSPLARLGILRSRRHNRDRSGSGASLGTTSSHRGGVVIDDDLVVVTVDARDTSNGKPGTRPSILRGQNRTSPIGQVPTPLPSGFRALRFDSTSSGSSREKVMDLTEQDAGSHVAALGLRSCSSAGSLAKFRRKPRAGKRPGSAGSGVGRNTILKSVSVVVSDFELKASNDVTEERIVVDEEEFDYGRPIVLPDLGVLDSKSHAAILLSERGLSFTSSSQSSLSPILANDGGDGTAAFPFSINKPPPLHLGESASSNPTQDVFYASSLGNHQGRRDSMSSTSTSDSRNTPHLELIMGVPVSGGGAIGIIELQHDLPIFARPSQERNDQEPALEKTQDVSFDSGSLTVHGLTERRAHTPPDINITSISSHAQAEALVQRAQQDILELAQSNELTPTTNNTGRSPLSARLAAYGESLALERKLREQKEIESKASGDKFALSQLASKSENPRTIVLTHTDGIERQHSLENKYGTPRVRSKGKDPQRPSTAEGVSNQPSTSSTSDQINHSHHQTRSASGFVSNRLSTELKVVSFVDEEPSQHAVSSTIPRVQQDPDLSSGYTRPTIKPCTPVLNAEQGQLSRVSSLDCLDTDTELGPAVFRVSTAPIAGPSPPRGQREQVKSASKLRRMGFSPAEQAGHVAPQNGSKRFGGIKSFMQTFKGKA